MRHPDDDKHYMHKLSGSPIAIFYLDIFMNLPERRGICSNRKPNNITNPSAYQISYYVPTTRGDSEPKIWEPNASPSSWAISWRVQNGAGCVCLNIGIRLKWMLEHNDLRGHIQMDWPGPHYPRAATDLENDKYGDLIGSALNVTDQWRRLEK
jgi:hypothetical protein